MRLSNLAFPDGQLGTVVQSAGLTLDLHNSADLQSIRHDVAHREAYLTWTTRLDSMGTGLDRNRVRLRFTDVDYLEVTPRDETIIDFAEDMCLEAVSVVEATDITAELIEYGVKIGPVAGSEGTHLFFQFRGGQFVRIGSGAVSLDVHPLSSDTCAEASE
jgi:hypothetical protein